MAFLPQMHIQSAHAWADMLICLLYQLLHSTSNVHRKFVAIFSVNRYLPVVSAFRFANMFLQKRELVSPIMQTQVIKGRYHTNASINALRCCRLLSSLKAYRVNVFNIGRKRDSLADDGPVLFKIFPSFCLKHCRPYDRITIQEY